jgi:hypothetical protein
MPRLHPVVACLLVMVALTASAAPAADPKEEEGAHPLAGRNGGLAELLRQAEAMEREAAKKAAATGAGPGAAAGPAPGAKPQATGSSSAPSTAPATTAEPFPRPTVSPQTPLFELHDAILRRNLAVDQSDVFAKIEALLKEQQTYVKLWRDARGQPTPMKRTELNVRLATCKDLMAEVREPLFRWLGCYGDLRRLLPQDRADPNLRSSVDVLKQEASLRPDFVEGRALAALGCVYTGQTDDARKLVGQARTFIERHGVLGAPVAADCCLVSLLLGTPSDIDAYVKQVRAQKTADRTSQGCRVVAMHAMLTGDEETAERFFGIALAKAEEIAEANESRVPDDLAGDAAFCFITPFGDAHRKATKARELLSKVPDDSTVWQVLRARAALAAESDDFDAAVTLVKKAKEHCPPSLADECDAMLERFKAKEPWRRKRTVTP